MKTAFKNSGEKVAVTDYTRNLGHGEQVRVFYQDGTDGFEHVEDLQDFNDLELSFTLEDVEGCGTNGGRGEMYFYKFSGGYIELPSNGDETFTTLSEQEIQEYYSDSQ